MKYIKILIISFCIMLVLSNNILAIDEIIVKGEKWLETGIQHTNVTMDTSKLKDGSDFLYNTLLTIATVVAVIVGAFLGIQYITAGISQKVQVKESLFPYIVSCIVVFGSLGIWKLVVTILGQIE